ncbi:MAG: hypothetical protein R6U61_02250 [Thermoplasmata archaeon]
MKVEFEDRIISFDKEENKLDELAFRFSSILSDLDISHVFVSGYVVILFGRNRTSEDIDLICEEISYDKFKRFWEAIDDEFDCIITSDQEDAYNGYLKDKLPLRFARKGEIIPNIELKFERTSMHRKALEESLEVHVNDKRIPISPLEQQIAYKLFMRSEKDLEDARFLFKLFQEHLDTGELLKYIEKLEVPLDEAKYYLGWS